MRRAFAPLVLAAALAACPGYDQRPNLEDQSGLVPADDYARYGVEQAQAMALAREYAWALESSDRDDATRAAEHAVAYAATLPDVESVVPDTLGFRLTIQFRSGWRTMVNPVRDGKRGAETPNLPAGAGQAAAPAS